MSFLDSLEKNGWVALVGAGPGDPGLITVRGMELLTRCDALVYDNLMADQFVALSTASQKIFVGKAGGVHAMPQEEISSLLVKLAKEGKRVVRLKGGDPFVFGRGGEECQELARAGVPYEVVPAVTAAVAASSYAGVPVTHREISRGVTLVTGHFAKDRQVELPWAALAGLNHTLVFYMAVAAMERVCNKLQAAGLDPDTPAMVLERATTGAQRGIKGTVSTIVEIAREQKAKPPALLMIGEVVRLGEILHWLPERPLSGKSILFTRAVESSYEAIQKLRAMGADVLDVPVVSTIPRGDSPEVVKALELVREFSALAFTSALAVEIFFNAMQDHGLDVRNLAGLLIAAGSPTVERAMRRHGVVPDIAPEIAGTGKLAKLLGEKLPGGASVLLPRSSAADDTLLKSLTMAGFRPVSLFVYDTVPVDLSWLKVKLAHWRPDAALFLSGTCVRAILEAAPEVVEADPRPILGCVGEKTAMSLIREGFTPDVVPDAPGVEALIHEIVQSLLSKTSD